MDTNLTKAQEELKPTVGKLLEDQKDYDPFKDDNYLTEGTFLLARFSEAKKTVEDQRIAFTKPLNESLRNINQFFKRFSDPISQADRELRTKLANHRKALEAKKVEEQISAAENDEPEVPELRKKIGGVVVKKVWTFKILDKESVPHQYLVVDEVAVRAAIRSGVREIAGITIFQEDQVSL